MRTLTTLSLAGVLTLALEHHAWADLDIPCPAPTDLNFHDAAAHSSPVEGTSSGILFSSTTPKDTQLAIHNANFLRMTVDNNVLFCLYNNPQIVISYNASAHYHHCRVDNATNHFVCDSKPPH